MLFLCFEQLCAVTKGFRTSARAQYTRHIQAILAWEQDFNRTRMKGWIATPIAAPGFFIRRRRALTTLAHYSNPQAALALRESA